MGNLPLHFTPIRTVQKLCTSTVGLRILLIGGCPLFEQSHHPGSWLGCGGGAAFFVGQGATELSSGPLSPPPLCPFLCPLSPPFGPLSDSKLEGAVARLWGRGTPFFVGQGHPLSSPLDPPPYGPVFAPFCVPSHSPLGPS